MAVFKRSLNPAVVSPSLHAQFMQPSDKPPGPDQVWMEAFTPGRLALVIGLFLFALYPGVVLGSRTFFYQDFGLFTYPVAHHAHESFWHGEIPLWNPLNNCGVPFLAQWNTSVCYPLSLVYLLLPLPWSLNIFCLGHLVLAGVGMYLLAYRWTQNRLAASIAGLAFGLNGLMLNCLLWTSNLTAMSWQPLVILCVERAWQRGGSRRIALAALAGAMQMFSGAPEIIIFTWVLLAILWLCEVRRESVPLWLSMRRLTATVVLVAGLALVQILPFLDLLTHSNRDASYAAADAWPLPVWGLANLVVPQFHASQSVLGTYHLHGQYWTKSYYVGVGVLSLALIGLWRERRFRTWWLGGAALAGLMLALGNAGVVYGWLKQIVPWVSVARYPIKFVALAVFAIPLLAAFGFNSLQSGAVATSRRRERSLILTGVLLLMLAVGTLCAARWFPKQEEIWPVTWQSALSRMILLAGFIGGFIALLRVRTARARCLLAVAVVALVGLDLATAGMRLHPAVATRAFGPMEFNMSFRPRLGESRALVSRQAERLLDRAGTADLVAYCVGIRGALFKNNNLLEGIPKVDGFCSVQLKHQAEIYFVLTAGTNSLAEPLSDFLGVAQVTAPDNFFAWQSRSNSLPLVTAGQRPAFASDTEILKAVAADDFDPRRVVYLPAGVQTEVGATNGSDAKIISAQWAAHRIRISVEAATPAVVVVAQSFYHNWRASVDGHPTPIWRANHAFQALEVPTGRHEVTLVYQDKAFQLGAIISAIAVLTCLVMLTRRASPDDVDRGDMAK